MRQAADILGGDEPLRLHLGASEVDFLAWNGKDELPRNIFLRLVDIITREETKAQRGRR